MRHGVWPIVVLTTVARLCGSYDVNNEAVYDYECDLTDAKIDVEHDGRYHYSMGGDDGLDMAVSAYRRFESLSRDFPVQWSRLPKEAQRREAWRFVSPSRGGVADASAASVSSSSSSLSPPASSSSSSAAA